MGADADSELKPEMPSAVTFYKTEEIAGISPKELPDFFNQPKAEMVRALLNLGGDINFPIDISTHEDLVSILEAARNNRGFESLANMLQAIGVDDWMEEATKFNSQRNTDGRFVRVQSRFESDYSDRFRSEQNSQNYNDTYFINLEISEGEDQRGVHYPLVTRTREVRMGKIQEGEEAPRLHTIVIIDRMTIPDGKNNSYAERITTVDVDQEQLIVGSINDKCMIVYIDPTDGKGKKMDFYHKCLGGYKEAWINEDEKNGEGYQQWTGGNYGGNSSYPVNYVSEIFPVDKSLEELIDAKEK